MSDINLLITGLPGDMSFSTLLTTFRALFRKVHIKQFSIRDFSDNIDGDYKQMTVELKRADAHRALNFCNSKPLTYNNMKYPLVVQIVDGSTDERNEDLGRKPEMTRARSRSPRHRHEPSKLDEHRPHTSREFDRCNDIEPYRRRHQPEHLPRRSREKYIPMEKEYRSSNSRYPPAWSRNSRCPPARSRSSPVRSRYPPDQSRYAPNRSRYPPEWSNNSRYSPARSRTSYAPTR